MPTCRLCSGTYPREFFIHGNGPNTQVCVRCAVEQGYVSKDEATNLYDDTLKSARLSTVTRRYKRAPEATLTCPPLKVSLN